jgi:hypothetical protein
MHDEWYAKAAAEFGGSLARMAQWQREIDSLRAMMSESS